MPIITIKSNALGKKLAPEKIAEDIRGMTGIGVSRLQIIVEYLPPEDFFTDDVHVIIHVAAAEKNGKELIQALMKACVSAAAEQLNIAENCIAVYAHPIENGYLLLNNKFY